MLKAARGSDTVAALRPAQSMWLSTRVAPCKRPPMVRLPDVRRRTALAIASFSFNLRGVSCLHEVSGADHSQGRRRQSSTTSFECGRDANQRQGCSMPRPVCCHCLTKCAAASITPKIQLLVNAHLPRESSTRPCMPTTCRLRAHPMGYDKTA